jgi:hypothetical protein
MRHFNHRIPSHPRPHRTGGFTAGFIVDRFGYNTAFLTSGALAGLGLTAVLLLMPETARVSSPPLDGLGQTAAPRVAAEYPSTGRPPRRVGAKPLRGGYCAALCRLSPIGCNDADVD